MINKKLRYHLIPFRSLTVTFKIRFQKVSQGGKMNNLNPILPYRFPTTIDTFV